MCGANLALLGIIKKQCYLLHTNFISAIPNQSKESKIHNYAH